VLKVKRRRVDLYPPPVPITCTSPPQLERVATSSRRVHLKVILTITTTLSTKVYGKDEGIPMHNLSFPFQEYARCRA